MGFLVLASLLWSVSFALIGQSGIDADLLAALRLGLAALVFVPFVARRGVGRSAPAPLLLIGAVQFGLMYVLVLRAYGFLAAHEVALLTITTPLFVVAFDGFGERRGRAAVGAALAVAGAFALRGAHGVGAEAGAFWIGFALVQGANAAFAAGQVAYRRVARTTATAREAAQGFAWLYLGGFAVASAVALATVERADLDLTRDQALVVLYLGLVPSGLAFYLWNVGATRVGIGTLAVMNNLKIPLAVAVALLPPFGGWRALDGTGAARLAASAVLLALALAVVSAPEGRTTGETT